MDSKSISRKGVGVRLPSLVPAPAHVARLAELESVAREVGRVLWGQLGRQLRATRLELDSMRAALRSASKGAAASPLPAQDGEHGDARARRAGWCLGALAAARGIDLLHARREPAGLRWLVGALAEARGLELSPSEEQLPLLAGSAHGERELALLAAWGALQVGRPKNGVLRWVAREHGGLRQLAFVPAEWPAGLAARCARLSAAGEGAPSLAFAPDELVLSWS